MQNGDLNLTKEGCPELKAVLQWLAASEGRRSLLYFPFELKIGPAPLFARRNCLANSNPCKIDGFSMESLCCFLPHRGPGLPKIIGSFPG